MAPECPLLLSCPDLHLQTVIFLTRRDLKGQKEAPKGGMAPVYGVAGSLPDRGAVADILVAYQSAMLDP